MRVPTPLPKWEWSCQTVKDYFPELNKYINDQFAMREKLIRSYAHINHFFGISINPEKAVIGKKDYLFLGNRWENIINQTMGNDVFGPNHLNRWLYHMELRQTYLEKRGIGFCVLVVPNKHSVYPEYLPSWVEPSSKTSLFKLQNAKKSFRFINLLPYFLSAKKEYGQRLYIKTDSHWSYLGAYRGYQVIIQALRQDLPQTVPLTLESKDFIYTPNSHGGDLAQMLRLDGRADDFYMQIDPSKLLHNSGPIKKTDFDGNEQPLDTFNHVRWYEKASFRNTIKPYTVLVLMDSFMEKMAVFLNHTFGTTIYCHYKDVDGSTMGDLVEKYKPDFVIYQMVERSLNKSHLTAGDLLQYADVKPLAQYNGTDLHQHVKQLNAITVQNQNRRIFAFKATSNDPYFTLPVSKVPQNCYLYLELEIFSPEDSALEVFYQTQNTNHYSPAQSVKQQLSKGPNKIRLPILEKGIRGDRIRIDPGTVPGLYQISSISLMSLAQ